MLDKQNGVTDVTYLDSETESFLMDDLDNREQYKLLIVRGNRDKVIGIVLQK